MEAIISGILSKCICGCKSDCCETEEQTGTTVRKKKKFFHIEANLGRNKSKKSNSSLTINNEK